MLWSPNSSVVPPALPNAVCKPAGSAAGPALILPKEDDGHQTSFATSCLCMVEDGSQPPAAVPVVLNLELKQEVRSKFWLHTARKCLELKL